MLILLALTSCVKPDCRENTFRDDFKNAVIVENHISLSTIYVVAEGDTNVFSKHYFDEQGRTDSAIFFINEPETTYIETTKFVVDQRQPFSSKQFRKHILDSVGESEALIFNSFVDSVNMQDVEIFYQNGEMTNYSIFKLNDKYLPFYRSYFDKDSVLIYSTAYFYNNDDQLIKSEKYDPDSLLLGYRVFEYNYSNAVASMETTYVSDTLYDKTTREFFDCYNLKEEREYDYKDELQSMVKYTLSSHELPASFQINWNDENEYEVFYYVYE